MCLRGQTAGKVGGVVFNRAVIFCTPSTLITDKDAMFTGPIFQDSCRGAELRCELLSREAAKVSGKRGEGVCILLK